MAYLMRNPFTCSIISHNGYSVGCLNCDIIPHDDDGNEFDEIPDNPEELIGQPISYKIYIQNCKDLPENFCKNTQVEYTNFGDNLVYKTKVVQGKNRNPEFEEYFEHHIEYLTKDDIDYLISGKVYYWLFSFALKFMLMKKLRKRESL
jgi:hypothetical protein